MVNYSKRDMVKQGATVIVLALSVGVLSRLIDWERAVVIVSDADPTFFALAFLSYYATVAIRGKRWQILLSNIGADIGFSRAYVVILLSLFFNMLLPAKGGDLYRAQLVTETEPVTRSAAFGTVVFKRVVDIGVLVAGIVITFLLLEPSLRLLENRLFLTAALLSAAALAFLTLLWYGPASRLPVPLQTVYCEFQSGIRSITNRREAGWFLSLTVIIWIFSVVRMGFVAVALNFDVSLPELVLVALLVSFLSGLPLTPAGLGIVEAISTSLLFVFGHEGTIGFSFILLDRIISVVSVIIIGAFVYAIVRRNRAI